MRGVRGDYLSKVRNCAFEGKWMRRGDEEEKGEVEGKGPYVMTPSDMCIVGSCVADS